MKKEKDLTKSIGLGMVIGAAIGVATIKEMKPESLLGVFFCNFCL
jgi:uncharacterized membrane protein (Fun14 family)